jgi:hypothetical protein
MNERKTKMEKLEYLIQQIQNCDLCNGQGAHYYGNGEDFFDFETCICNPYDLIIDGGDVIYDNGLLSEPELFSTSEAL